MRSPKLKGLVPALLICACLAPSLGQAKLIDLGVTSQDVSVGSSQPDATDNFALPGQLEDALAAAPKVVAQQAATQILTTGTAQLSPMAKAMNFVNEIGKAIATAWDASALPASPPKIVNASVANTTTSSGAILGHARIGAENHAMLWTKVTHGRYQSTDLNEFVPASSGWKLSDATSVNSQGEIIGLGTRDGVRHGFKLQLKGIDVASYAGPLSIGGLQQAREADQVQAVVVGAFQGKNPNKYAEQQLGAARQAGLRTGAYVFLNFASNQIASGADQASVALQACGKEAGNLSFMAVDIEPGMKGARSQASRVKFIDAAVKTIKSWGVQPIIYASNANVWNHMTGWSNAFAHLPLWTPRYDGNADLKADGKGAWEPFGGWYARQGKQYSDQKSFEAKTLEATLGCGSVDLNLFAPVLFGKKPVAL